MYNNSMTKLTNDQIQQLHMYSTYTTDSTHPLFTFQDMLDVKQITTIIETVQAISKSPNKDVAASYFSRRFGMFIAMQMYNLIAYEEIWKGDPKQLQFGHVEEYGNQVVSQFVKESDWIDVSMEPIEQSLTFILHEQCMPFITSIRTISNLSSRTFWENIFGFLLWHFHVLSENLVTAEEANAVLETLKEDTIWQGISDTSLFAIYLKGSTPKTLLNTTVRTTCCFSKDVPGLMQCGYCPLKK